MKWKQGDTAKALHNIVIYTFDELGKPKSRQTLINAGNHFTVNDITDGPCQLMLDIGVLIQSPNLNCVCDKCKPTHEVPAKIEKGEQTFLLSGWFVNTNDRTAMAQALEKSLDNPKEKRRKLLTSNPTITPNFLPAKKPKETTTQRILTNAIGHEAVISI